MGDENGVRAINGHAGGEFRKMGIVAELNAEFKSWDFKQRDMIAGREDFLLRRPQLEFTVCLECTVRLNCQVRGVYPPHAVGFGHARQNGDIIFPGNVFHKIRCGSGYRFCIFSDARPGKITGEI